MKKILIVLLLILFVSGCGDSKMEDHLESLDSVIASGEYIVVDVRTESEFEDEHVVGSLNIPYDEIDEDIELDKDLPILVYCMSGGRSKIAYEALKKLGYTVYDMGGIDSVALPKE